MPIRENWTFIRWRTSDDLPQEVKGTVYWTKGLDYQVNIMVEDQTRTITRIIDIEFINDKWFILEPTTEGYQTNVSRKFPKEAHGTDNWSKKHPKNPQNVILATAESFRNFLLGQGKSTRMSTPQPEINMKEGSKMKKKKKMQTKKRSLRPMKVCKERFQKSSMEIEQSQRNSWANSTFISNSIRKSQTSRTASWGCY